MARKTKVVKPGRGGLEAFLADASRPAGTMSYHQLQGFLFTVASAPELVLPSEWMPAIFDGTMPVTAT